MLMLKRPNCAIKRKSAKLPGPIAQRAATMTAAMTGATTTATGIATTRPDVAAILDC
jgi:hypothetical protein